MTPGEFGLMVRAVRISRGKSVRDVAAVTGISASAVSRVESGGRIVPNARSLLRLAQWANLAGIVGTIEYPEDAS